jgi:hypothetical protein
MKKDWDLFTVLLFTLLDYAEQPPTFIQNVGSINKT